MKKRTKGDGSLYRRGRIWWISYLHPDGSRKSESTGSERRPVALNLLRKRTGAGANNLPVVARAEQLGAIMVEELAPLRAQPGVREIRRLGAMVAVEFVDKAANKDTIAKAFEQDVLLISAGAHDQVTRFIPALNIVEADLRAGLRTYVAAARAVAETQAV